MASLVPYCSFNKDYILLTPISYYLQHQICSTFVEIQLAIMALLMAPYLATYNSLPTA